MSRRKLVAGNRKMNGSLADLAMIETLNKHFDGKTPVETVMCVPSLYLMKFTDEKNFFKTGAQNCHHEEKGAFTGDLSALMLQEVGVKYVIVGHSERRAAYQESNTLVASKAQAALKAEITPIICIGETEEIYQSGQSAAHVTAQALESLPEDFSGENCVIAYEPIWAIGTGRIPTEEEIAAMSGAIRKATEAKHGPEKAAQLRILYGGSVTDKNAAIIARLADTDGVLVGGACLKAENFIPIIEGFSF